MTTATVNKGQIELKPSELTLFLETCIKAQRPAMVLGAPGIGKSRVVAAAVSGLPMAAPMVAHRVVAAVMNAFPIFGNGWEFRDVRTTLLDPVDLRGLPTINGGTTTWAPPDWWPTAQAVAAGRASTCGVVFFDELPAAQRATQVACYQALWDRRLGEASLAPGWSMLAAGNRVQDRAAGQRLDTALASRFVHATMVPDLQDWSSWALGAGMHPAIIAFLRFKRELLYQFPKSEDLAFPCPRTWEFVSDVLKAQPSRSIEYALIEGAVGIGAAIEAHAYVEQFRKLQGQTIDGILLNPSTATLPPDASTKWAVSMALSSATTVSNLSRVLTYLERMSEEYNALAVKGFCKRDETLLSTPEMNAWAVRHPNALS